MRIFEKSKWIWFKGNYSDDEYGDFFSKFLFDRKNGAVLFRISCDGDYTLYINGRYAASNQYGDYEHYKIYDEIDISDFSYDGENSISLIVWHHGIGTSKYTPGKAGVIFELVSDENIILASDENTLSRKNPAYESGRCKFITPQLGFGFAYDASCDDGKLFSGEGFGKAAVINKKCTLYPRPNKKLCIKDELSCAKITSGNDEKYYLIDLGTETLGLLHIEFYTETRQKIRIDWGEDLQSSHVRRIIGDRDFSVEYNAKEGDNIYTNYMLRLGGRYLEIYSEWPIKLRQAGLISQYYPVKDKKSRPLGEDERRIYELCLNTLKLCMMEHYADCPWREQAFYAFDSRNQMLSGYFAFEGGNFEYVKSNLKLIKFDPGIDGLLSICFPSAGQRAIPSFSLHFFTAVLEYLEHSGDIDFAKEIYDKLNGIIKTFIFNSVEGLIFKFCGEKFWNFYDWTDNLCGTLGKSEEKTADAVINLLFLKALQEFKKITVFASLPFEYEELKDTLPSRIRSAFLDKASGLYSITIGDGIYTSLVNSLAVITGVANKNDASEICEKIISGKIFECTLSLKCFEYDALIKTDIEKYRSFILSDIRKNYMHMISSGAASAWETIMGASDFENAGSLCHGWSAIPIYYYHKLGIVK